GATWVCQHVGMPLPQEKVDQLLSLLQQETTMAEGKPLAYDILHDALCSAMLAIIGRAKQHNPQLSKDDLHSTLLVFLAVPLDRQRLFVASTQVGDSTLFCLQKDQASATGERWDWLQHAQIQGAGNEVLPFTRSTPDTWRQFFSCQILQEAIF